MFALPPAFLTVSAATDPDFASVRLLLHMDGTNGSTTFTDNSPTPKTVTANGNVQVSTTTPKFGSGAALFDGTTDYLTAGVAADWRFLHDSTTSYTIQFWLKCDNFAAERVVVDTTRGSSANAGMYVSVDASRNINVVITRAVAASFILNASWPAAFPNDTTGYHFVQLVYQPALGTNQAELFVDGVSQGLRSRGGDAPNGADPLNALFVGAIATGGSNSLLGRLDDLRITATARANSVPTAAFPNS